METLRRTAAPSRIRFRPGAAPFIPLLLALAAATVPWLLTHDFLALGFALSRGFAIICHQHPDRSFWILGAPIAVCARCVGIYVGAAVGLLIQASRIVAIRLLIFVAALNLLDALVEIAGLHGNWMGVRFALGAALGAAAGLLVSSALAEEKLPTRIHALSSR